MTGRGQARADSPSWLGLDVLAVVLFAAVGRRSHAEGVTVVGVRWVAWPFLVGLVLGWCLTRAWARPLALWPVAVASWLLSVAVGMGLRYWTGAGTALPFVVVATVVLGLLMLGWRPVVRRLLARSLVGSSS